MVQFLLKVLVKGAGRRRARSEAGLILSLSKDEAGPEAAGVRASPHPSTGSG
jgi:hypothetical protein